MNVGDLVRIKKGHSTCFSGKEGIIIDKTIEVLPPGTERILVYKLLVEGIIINIPLKWMVLINTHPETQEK
tara:strand:+ start:1284 stop:1496 length:213 start_codon:yes stop_codon:yes gene_type:complete